MHYLTRITRIALIGIGVLCLASGQIVPGFAQPAQAQANAQGVNGWNVIRATFDGGVFQQTAPGQWTEFGNSGQNFYFEERNRDDWSVYLHDVSRDISIQIDIFRNWISYAQGSGQRTDLYQITSSAAGSNTSPANNNPLAAQGINGFNVIRANYDGGLFQLMGGDEWIEVTDDAHTYRFRETQRDDWSVYMFDASRNVHLQIDIHRQMITLADGDGPHRNLYSIVSAHRR
jgi:hypothetical protein